MTLEERARTVRGRADLVAFLAALSEENRAAWTNADLASFLGAMAAWAEDMDGYYANRGEDIDTVSPWTMFADILMGAQVYE